MEASALRAPGAVPRRRLGPPVALLRLRSDEQLVALFRAGQEEAFRVIYERYRARLFAYARQMLPGSRQDAEDALQDVFVRAYRHLRSSDRELALRPWLYRVAHNRCVDALRRPAPPSPELLEVVRAPQADPLAEAERREDLRRLVADIRRLPDQQRSALAMRELEGMAYGDIAAALDVTVAAVKSLLVRARIGLAQAGEARDAACVEIREQLTLARDRGVRASGHSRRHLRDCAGCRAFRTELRGVERSLAVFAPALGPVALAAKVLGLGGAAGGASGAAAGAGGGAGAGLGAGVASGGALAGTGIAAGGAVAGAAGSQVVAVVAVAAVAAGGAAVERKLEHRASPPPAPAAVAPAPPAAPRLFSPAGAVPAPAARARWGERPDRSRRRTAAPARGKRAVPRPVAAAPAATPAVPAVPPSEAETAPVPAAPAATDPAAADTLAPLTADPTATAATPDATVVDPAAVPSEAEPVADTTDGFTISSPTDPSGGPTTLERVTVPVPQKPLSP